MDQKTGDKKVSWEDKLAAAKVLMQEMDRLGAGTDDVLDVLKIAAQLACSGHQITLTFS